jgi:hypothetical protein
MSNMSVESDHTAWDRSTALPERTELSFEFETLWRSLPTDGLVPRREAFRPERAPRFLRHLVLAEARLNVPSICIRLSGTEFDARLQTCITGANYLEFVSEADRPLVISRARDIVERPCGMWEIRETHYERGYAQLVENTSFPLRSGHGGVDLLLVLTQPLGGSINLKSTHGKIARTKPTKLCRYIDLSEIPSQLSQV